MCVCDSFHFPFTVQFILRGKRKTMAARMGLNLNSLYSNENDKMDYSPKMKKRGGGVGRDKPTEAIEETSGHA